MNEKVKDTQNKPKGFFNSLFEKIDAKLKEKANQGTCCAPKDKAKESDKSSCCR